jgi:hypothetical protein
MQEQKEPEDQRYEILKNRLWNQPRPRQFLERLERYGVRPVLLERVARLFIAGRHGEAEILAAVYYDLFRHRDRSDLLRRIGALRTASIRTAHHLSAASRQLHRLKIRRASFVLGYPDWTDFLKKEFGLGERIAVLIEMIGEQTNDRTLDALLQKMIHGYPTAAVHRQRSDLFWIINRAAELSQGLEDIQRHLSELKQLFASVQENLSSISAELHKFRNWEAHRVLGYNAFSEFASKELDLSEEVAGALLIAREQTNRLELGDFFQIMIKGYLVSSEPVPNEK